MIPKIMIKGYKVSRDKVLIHNKFSSAISDSQNTIGPGTRGDKSMEVLSVRITFSNIMTCSHRPPLKIVGLMRENPKVP